MNDSIIIFEDEGYRNLLPLVYLRPTYELLSGILTLRQKIEYHFPKANIALHSRKYLEKLLQNENPSTFVNKLNQDSKSILLLISNSK